MPFDITTATPILETDTSSPKVSGGFDFSSAEVLQPNQEKLQGRGLWNNVKYFMGEGIIKPLARGVETIPAQFEALIQMHHRNWRALASDQLKEDGAVFGTTEEEFKNRTPEQAKRIERNNRIIRNSDKGIETSKRLQQNWIDAAYTGIEAPSETFSKASPIPFAENFQMTRMIALGVESVPMLGMAAAVTAITKSPTIGAALLGSLEAAEESNIAEEMGLSNEEATFIFATNALMLSALETVPLTSFMKGGKLPIRMFRTAAQEGGEEVLQGLWVQAVAKLGYDETRNLTEGLMENFIAGFVSGGTIGAFGPSDINNRIKDAKEKGVDVDAMTETIADQVMDEAEKITDSLAEKQSLDVFDKEQLNLIKKAYSGKELTPEEMDKLREFAGRRMDNVAEVAQETAVEPEKVVEGEVKKVDSYDSILEELGIENDPFVKKLKEMGKTSKEILDSKFAEESLANNPDIRRRKARIDRQSEIDKETDPARKLALLINPENPDAVFSDILGGVSPLNAKLKSLLEGDNKNWSLDEILGKMGTPDSAYNKEATDLITEIYNQNKKGKDSAKKTPKQTRAQKYESMVKRIDEIKKQKENLNTQESLFKETLSYFKEVRKEFKNRIKRFAGGQLNEEYNELPIYYRSAKDGITLDEAAMELGLTDSSEVLDHLNDLESQIEKTKNEIELVKEVRKEETQKKIIKTEIESLQQRLADYRAGKLEGVKNLIELRKDLKSQVIKVPPSVAKKMISTIEKIKNKNNLEQATERFNELFRKHVEQQKRLKEINKIIKKYKRPENIIDVTYQEKIEKLKESLGGKKGEQKKSLNKMSTEELVELSRQITELTDKGKALFNKKKEAKVMASEIMRGALIKAAGGEIDIEAIGSLEEVKARKGMTKFERSFIRPIQLVNKIFGDLGKQLFYKSLNDAEKMAQGNKINRILKIQESLKNNKISRFDLGKVITIDGVSYQMNDIMAFYAQKDNPHARKAYIEGNRISEETFDKFIAEFESKHKNYVKAVGEIKEIISNKFEALRLTMGEAFNVTMQQEKDYFPMFRERLDNVADPEGILGLDLVGDMVVRNVGGVDYKAVEKGFGITRKEIAARNQMPLSSNFIGDAIRAVDSQEHFLGYAYIQKMFNNVKSDTTLQNSVIYNSGQEAWKALDDYMNKAINPRSQYQTLGFIEKRVKAIRKALSTVYLGYNIVTMGKQFASFPLVLKKTNIAQLTSSIFRIISDKELRQKIYQESDLIRTRVMERDIDEYMQEMSKLSSNDVFRGLQIALDTIGKNAFQMLINMDKFTVIAAYDAVYNAQKNKLGDTAAREAAEEIILKTQPQGRLIDLPEAYRSNNEMIRMTLLFTNQLNQIYNLIRYDIPQDFTKGRHGEGLTAIAGVMMSSFLIYAISHGGKFPEDEDEFWAAMLEGMLGSSVASFPILGNIAMSYFRGYSPSISPIDSIFDSVKFIKSEFKNEDYVQATLDSLINVAALSGFGVPYNQFRRTMQGAIDLYEGETEDLRRLIYSKSALFE